MSKFKSWIAREKKLDRPALNPSKTSDFEALPPLENVSQIVVVGAQSCGKSSVLENLVGIEFLPRGSGIVTRRPLIIELLFQPLSETFAEFRHQLGRKWYDFEEVRQEIILETDRKTGGNLGISSDPIYLKICSPHDYGHSVTLVDLPGLTKVPAGNQPADIDQQIRKMVMHHILKKDTFMLAVTASNTDVANSVAIDLCKQVDPKGDRTLAVLTKLDLMDQGTDAGDLLSGELLPRKNGWIGVINRSQKEINERRSMSQGREKELNFFHSHFVYHQMLHRVGTSSLFSILNKLTGLQFEPTGLVKRDLAGSGCDRDKKSPPAPSARPETAANPAAHSAAPRPASRSASPPPSSPSPSSDSLRPVPSASTAGDLGQGLQLSEQERNFYQHLFKLADQDRDGQINGAEAQFLLKSGLSRDVLKRVWEATANGQPSLGRIEFCMAMRLILLAQQGAHISMLTKDAARARNGSNLPWFDGIQSATPWPVPPCGFAAGAAPAVFAPPPTFIPHALNTIETPFGPAPALTQQFKQLTVSVPSTPSAVASSPAAAAPAVLQPGPASFSPSPPPPTQLAPHHATSPTLSPPAAAAAGSPTPATWHPAMQQHAPATQHTPHENTWDCFVSYAHVDAAVVFRYCDLLQAAGIKIWVDRELKAGQRWMLKIAEAMERCKSFICFLSPAYLSSKNCDDEMLFAHELRIPKFPVWLVDWKSIALRADYRMMLSSVNWTEQCKYGEGDDAVNKAAGALIEGLREELPKY